MEDFLSEGRLWRLDRRNHNSKRRLSNKDNLFATFAAFCSKSFLRVLLSRRWRRALFLIPLMGSERH